MLDDRLTSLEQGNEAAKRERAELTSLLNSREGDEKDQRSQSAAMRVDIDKLREDVQRFSGQLEETLYALNQKLAALEDANRKRQKENQLLDEQVQENTVLIQGIEHYLNFERHGTGKGAAPANVPETAAVQPLPEDQLYLTAKKALDGGDFETARQGFTELIKRFPKSQHSDNAQFWIGESYYKEKWYEKAILEYQKVIEKYPGGNKVQASLLKQGFAFLNLGDSANARLILKELIRKYPKSNESAIARKKLDGLK